MSERPAGSEAEASSSGDHRDVLDLVVQNRSLDEILAVVTTRVQNALPGSRASILMLGEDQLHLHVVAAPDLPVAYTKAIDGTAIGPAVGTCGTAAYENRDVITSDIRRDPGWEPWRHVAAEAGLRACWSTPFRGEHDRVLGTFAVYFGEPREPRPEELDVLHEAGYVVAVAVQHDAIRRLLRDTSRTHPVTGIPNRVVLRERLREIEARAAGTDGLFAVVQVSVEGVSPINESLGPSFGDAVLRGIGRRLTQLVGTNGLVAHVWGSDFVLVSDGLTDGTRANELAERARDAVSEPLQIEGMTLVVDASIGLSVYGGEQFDGPHAVDEPLRTVNVALERARSAGQQIGVYDPGWDPGADVRMLGPELRRGLEEEELTLAYQPIVALDRRGDDRFEALLRWTGPRGTVPPTSFVDVAERTGLVGDLGRYALERALAELRRQHDAGHRLDMSVNISVRQLADDSLPDVVAELLAARGIAPSRLTLEVTEGVLMTSASKAWQTLGRLRRLGIRLALDDFGTGYTQISYLRRFRFDEIKIGGGLIREMGRHHAARAIVVGTIAFAVDSGVNLVAEGVERREQADWLRDQGATHAQGYLFGTPAPSAERRRPRPGPGRGPAAPGGGPPPPPPGPPR